MYKVCFLLCLTLTLASNSQGWGSNKLMSYGQNEPKTLRIVGGLEAGEHQFPWQVRLKIKTNEIEYICGGSILSEHWVLTAAHCVDEANEKDITMIVGDHSIKIKEPTEMSYNAEKIIIHDKYVPERENSFPQYDFSLLRVNGSIKWNINIQPVFLGMKTEKYANVEVNVSGWGCIEENGNPSDVLRYATIKTITNNECNKLYPKQIRENMICTTDGKNYAVSDACQGDSGGPLVYEENSKFYLIGVVSWGDGCANKKPGVYGRVTHVSDWIHSTMNNVDSLTSNIPLVVTLLISMVHFMN